MSTLDLKKRASAREKMLHRASESGVNSVEKRAATRASLLERISQKASSNTLEARAKARRAYFQGANEPQAIGYPQEMKYPHMDPPIGDVRDWEQQWFEGAAAASKPNMGPAGAELELKKKLQRAEQQLVALKKMSNGKPAERKNAAAIVANELNSVVVQLDQAGYLQEAQEADGVLEELAAFIAGDGLVAEAEGKLTASQREELVKLANILDTKGHKAEADEIDQILAGE